MKSFIYFFSLSFILFPSSHAQVGANGCWATFYDQVNFSGDQINLYDGIDLPSMNLAEGNWKGRVRSLITGPNARLTLYGEESWLDRDFIVEPDTLIQSFEKLPWNYIESVRMICFPEIED